MRRAVSRRCRSCAIGGRIGEPVLHRPRVRHHPGARRSPACNRKATGSRRPASTAEAAAARRHFIRSSGAAEAVHQIADASRRRSACCGPGRPARGPPCPRPWSRRRKPRRRSRPGSRPKARPRPSGVVPATTPSGARARPARRALVPQLAAGAHHPAAEAARRRGAARRGSRAPARRAAPPPAPRPRGAGSASRAPARRQAMPDEQRLASRKARQRLDVGVEGRAAAGSRRCARGSPAARAARRASAIAAPGIHSPGASTTSLHPLLPSRAKIALARTIGRPPATR